MCVCLCEGVRECGPGLSSNPWQEGDWVNMRNMTYCSSYGIRVMIKFLHSFLPSFPSFNLYSHRITLYLCPMPLMSFLWVMSFFWLFLHRHFLSIPHRSPSILTAFYHTWHKDHIPLFLSFIFLSPTTDPPSFSPFLPVEPSFFLVSSLISLYNTLSFSQPFSHSLSVFINLINLSLIFPSLSHPPLSLFSTLILYHSHLFFFYSEQWWAKDGS